MISANILERKSTILILLYSLLYNCSPVWLSSATKKSLWKLVNTCHYRGLRVTMFDYKNRINREKLDIECQRASPKQWSKYAIANVVIKCLKAKEPATLYELITETLHTESRYPHVGKFYSNARGKFGR